MYIIKWFIEKTKQLVQTCKTKRLNRQMEEWYFAHEVTDEDLRQETEENEREYQRQCKEEDDRRNKLMQEIVEDQRIERQIREWEIEDQEWLSLNYSRCKGCGEFRCECCCDLYDEQQPEITSLGLRGPEEEETPLWLEQANTPCPDCGLLPEFCQCQYEE